MRDDKRNEKRKKSLKIALQAFFLRILVRLAGIEPTTPWFVAKYSIQLSYSREAAKYSTVYLKLTVSGCSGALKSPVQTSPGRTGQASVQVPVVITSPGCRSVAPGHWRSSARK